MDVQNTSLFVLVLSLVLILLYKNERYNAVEEFKNEESTGMTKTLIFLGNKLVDYKNIILKNFHFNSTAVDTLLHNTNQGPVALASGDINNTGQIKIKLDKKYEINGIIIKGIHKFSIKYYCEISKKFKKVYGPDRETIFNNNTGSEIIIRDFKTESGLSVVTNRINIYNMDKKQSESVKFQLYGMPLGNTIKDFLKYGYELPLYVLTKTGLVDTVKNIYQGQIIKDQIVRLSFKGNENFIVKSLSFNSNINKFKLFYKSKDDKDFKVLEDSLEILGVHSPEELFKYYFKHPIILNQLVIVVLSTINNTTSYFMKNVKLFVENTTRTKSTEVENKDIREGFVNNEDLDDQVIVSELSNTCEYLNLIDKNKEEERRTNINSKILKRIKHQEKHIENLTGLLGKLMQDYKKDVVDNDNKNILMNKKLIDNIQYGLSFNDNSGEGTATINA